VRERNEERKLYEDLNAELHELRARLREAEDTLDAIRNGAIDALVISGPDGPKSFTLSGADTVYRTFFQTMGEGGLTVNDQGTILSCNQKFSEMLGLSIDKILGASLQQFVVSDDIPTLETTLEKAFNDEARAEITLQSEQNVAISTSVVAFGPPSSSLDKLVCVVVTDITERKRSEMERLEIERKLHAQKLESLLVMAGGIAHDFNNQLAIVLGNLQLALSDRNLDPEAKLSIKSALKAAKRSAELSRQMLIYSGSSLGFPVDVDIKELLNKNSGLMKLVVSKFVSLNLDIYSKLSPIQGDPDQILRLVMNILLNASEAIGDQDGEVTLRSGIMDCDQAYLDRSRLQERPGPGRFVFLEFKDTGLGMDAETQRRIFDPFFTTKFTGRGLGMAEVMGIVKGHHGAIIMDSEMGKGTTIRVLFPVTKAAQEPSVSFTDLGETVPSAPDTNNRQKSILLVEDEEGVRNLVVRRLDILGYGAIVAADGEEGIRIFRERMKEIDLVMLDFKMPRMDGAEAFGELIRIKPDVKVLLSSGYTEDVVLERFPGPRPAGVLHKPYDMDTLKSELGRLLRTNI
jgi:two-component system, cell cycle sensor histidine kinase and response regulator CckA